MLVQDRTYVLHFDGIQEITPIIDNDYNQIAITLSSREKMSELITLCDFSERNQDPVYCYHGFSSGRKIGPLKLHLWRFSKPAPSHSDLLEVLEKALLSSGKMTKVFRYTLKLDGEAKKQKS